MDTSVREGMSLEAFLREGSRHKFEIIKGERKDILPTPSIHSEIIQTVFIALFMFVQAQKLGRVYSETTFILPDSYDPHWVRGSRIPDVMFYAGDRVAEYKAEHENWHKRPYPLIPDLVIEVVSSNDSFSAVNEKVDSYLADGVCVIWIVDPQREMVIVHALDAESPLKLSGEDALEAEDLLPGFKLSLPEIFNF